MSSRRRIDPFVGALIGAGVGAAAIGAFFLYRHLTVRKVVKATPESSVPLHRLQTTDEISAEWTAPTTADNIDSIFRVTTKNGFLPLVKSLRTLPAEFKELDAVSDALRILCRSREAVTVWGTRACSIACAASGAGVPFPHPNTQVIAAGLLAQLTLFASLLPHHPSALPCARR
jgi:hypothetical protein